MKKMIALLLVASIFLSLSGCLMVPSERETVTVPPIADKTGAYQKKVNEIVKLFEKYYIDEYDESKLEDYLAAATVLASGDRWSGYMTKDEYAQSLEEDNNEYVGIGVTVQLLEEGDEGFTVIDVTPNGAAMEAGVQIEDMIIAVEGKNAIELGMDGTKNMIKGEEGTDVTITFKRGAETFDLTITRKKIEIQVLDYELLDDGVGYIKLSQFTKKTATMTIAAIEYLIEDGATSLVFDMRFNPGGFKHELVSLEYAYWHNKCKVGVCQMKRHNYICAIALFDVKRTICLLRMAMGCCIIYKVLNNIQKFDHCTALRQIN